MNNLRGFKVRGSIHSQNSMLCSSRTLAAVRTSASFNKPCDWICEGGVMPPAQGSSPDVLVCVPCCVHRVR